MATPLAISIRSLSMSSYEHRPVSVAIDLGTSSSGYAFAFREKGTEKLKEPVLNKWKLASLSSSTDKTPTCLLLRPDKTFHSFGYTAEDTYASLCDKKKQKGWWYFEMFKMLLYKTKVRVNCRPTMSTKGYSIDILPFPILPFLFFQRGF